jgi:hypothetical protein
MEMEARRKGWLKQELLSSQLRIQFLFTGFKVVTKVSTDRRYSDKTVSGLISESGHKNLFAFTGF